jgi:hypothetical protein
MPPSAETALAKYTKYLRLAMALLFVDCGSWFSDALVAELRRNGH